MSPPPARVPVTGFVVSGGHSRRMGRDKALLAWGDTTLLDHAVARLRSVVADVTLLAGDTSRYSDRGLPVIPDSLTDGGPLAGVLAGLERAAPGGGLFLAVDVPRVPGTLLRFLLEHAQDRDAVVPVSPSGPQPLCAFYGPACRDPIRRRLAAGERKMTCFWPDVRLQTLEIRAELGFGDPEAVFLNVNSPDDYDRALSG